MNHYLDSDSALDLAADLGEVALDSFLQDGLLREVPVLGSLVNAVKVARSVPDKILAIKVRRMLQALDAVKGPVKKAIVAGTLGNAKERRKAGEVVLFAIDAADDLIKADYLGYLLCAYVEKKISLGEFRLFVHAVNASFLDDIVILLHAAKELQPLKRSQSLPPPTRALVGSGLVYISGAARIHDGQLPAVTDSGIMFCQVMLEFMGRAEGRKPNVG